MPGTGNRLLDILSPPLCHAIVQASRTVDLPLRTSMIAPGHAPAALYFMTRGAASTVVRMAEGGSVEVGMVGSEGLVGAAVLLGPAVMQSATFIQLAGTGLRTPIRFMRELFLESAELRAFVLQFLQAQVIITGQLAACNRLHEAQARLARWLLTAADIAHSETLGLTQEFLAEMLGSQRTTVALVAGMLQSGGLIDYSRGKVRILDRAGLSAITCDCYGITNKALAALYV